jgi:hypothetical protein
MTPVQINRADTVRAKFADLGLTNRDVFDAVAWSRKKHPQGEMNSPRHP